MAEDLIRYDVLTQDALRGVVRKVLTEAARAGLPGDHHFYIAFDTSAPGVRVSSRLRERFPEEMTVILQHQFWDLAVTEHAFEVGLSFSGVPERLLVPFTAIKGFFDPSVEFGMTFDVVREDEADQTETDAKPELSPAVPIQTKPDPIMSAPVAAKVKPATSGESKAADKAASKEETDDGETADKGAAVVSLDAFRKKT